MTTVKSAWNVLWVQPDGPGTVPQLLTCYAMDSVTEPRPSTSPQYCWNPVSNSWEITALTEDPPDLPSGTLEGLMAEQADYMEKMLRTG